MNDTTNWSRWRDQPRFLALHCYTASVCMASAVALSIGSCTRMEAISAPFIDTFDRADLGDNYLNTGAPYQLREGKLAVQGAYNKPLWLKRRLPRHARIELDATSFSPEGDLKLEVWGDGRSYAEERGAYLASSYVLIFGGWSNSTSAIARLDEHGADRKERHSPHVVSGKTYHWTITRQGNRLDWSIDGAPFLSFDDKAPLEGEHHAYLGFNNWASKVTFDNLSITPLP